MKQIISFLIVLNFCYCNNSVEESSNDSSTKEFIDITNQLSFQDFENIKNFILAFGDKQTYRNYDNNNPHYSFEGFECYLNSEIGQENINNDPLISDFNQITIQDLGKLFNYYDIQIVREGDIDNSKIKVIDGMKEGNVYLLKYYDNDLNIMKDSLNKYIEVIQNEIVNH